MSGFKLIGIRTRYRVSVIKNPETTDYLKILQENTYYPFHSCFDYDVKKDILLYLENKETNLYSFQKANIDKRMG